MPPLSRDELDARCRAITLLVLDVDGVLTDGLITINDLGVETKSFHVRDGAAIAAWRRAGHQTAILSGRRSPAVDHRASELGISPVVQGASEKLAPFESLVREAGRTLDQVAYVGDDLPDLPVLTLPNLGLACCPADAVPEVRDAAHLVADAPGGRGAVRAIIQQLLITQNRWPEA